MSSFWWSPDHKEPQVMFGALEAYFTTLELFSLFKETAEGLLEDSKMTQESRNQVIDILNWVYKRAKKWNDFKVKIDDKSTHDQIHSELRILQTALQDLENLKKKRKRIGDDQRDLELQRLQREDDAIEVDFMEFRRAVTNAFPNQHEEIKVYNMEDPRSPPYIIEEGSLHPLTGHRVIEYLKDEFQKEQAAETRRLVDARQTVKTRQVATPIAVHLWARQRGKHKLTRDELSWRHIPTEVIIDGVQKTVHIEGMTLEFIKRTSTMPKYFVALTVQSNSDVAKIIDLTEQGNSFCTSVPPCLGVHFARRLKGCGSYKPVGIDSGDGTRRLILDADLCEQHTNRLLVWCEPANTPSGVFA